MTQTPLCWCGNSRLEPFSADYLHCAGCHSLVQARMPDPERLTVRDDGRDLYGKGYYDRLVRCYGYPPLEERMRGDLPERCLYWLRGLLKYKLPPGRVLELGCGHGAFVALLREAGFDATGLDLSPGVLELARKTFDIPVLLGPVEAQQIPAGSLDAIVLMDVLEHFPDPVATLRYCISLLREDGIFFLQTPEFRPGLSFAALESGHDRFLEQLKPDEHLYLFSRASVEELFRRVGAGHVRFEPALFGFYDMSLVAGRRPLAVYAEAEGMAALAARPGSRVVLALMDLDCQMRELRRGYQEMETALGARIRAVDGLEERLAESEADRAARLENIRALEKQLGETRAELEGLREVREAQAALLGETERQRALLSAHVEKLQASLAESEADRAARLESIRALEKQLGETRAELEGLREAREAQAALLGETERQRALLSAQVEKLQASLAELEAGRAARLENIRVLEKQLGETRAELEGLREAREAQAARLEALEDGLARADGDRSRLAQACREMAAQQARTAERAETLAARLQDTERECAGKLATQEAVEAGLRLQLTRMEASRSEMEARVEALSARVAELDGARAAAEARLAEAAGRCQARENLLGRLRRSYVFAAMRAVGLWGWLDVEAKWRVRLPRVPARRRAGLKRVAIDLTPVLPGGENGGAKVLAIELIGHLARRKPDCEFILLTSEQSHDELGVLDGPNVRRVCVNRPHAGLPARSSLAALARRVAGRVLPAPAVARLGGLYREVSQRIPMGEGLVRSLDADLLFCPFTAPYFFDPSVPVVSVVHDLQYLYYGQFFDAREVEERDRNARQACRLSSRVVCVSEHVRRTVLENMNVPPERAEVIHTTLARRLPPVPEATRARVLGQWNLAAGRFLLYPANFWPHKNHEMLLAAFGLYRAAHAGSDLKLVLTGAPGLRRDYILEAVSRMGLDEAVVLPGYIPEEELAVLMATCMAVIFPSLFEGFGMPLLEAMAAGRPLLCSNSTSLPEVAGEAALFFDPRKPGEIAGAIARLEGDPALWRQLAGRSAARLARFGGAEDMAARYLKVFHDAIEEPAKFPAAVYGVHGDGWMGERMTVITEAGRGPRRLVLRLWVPPWVPLETVTLYPRAGGAAGKPYVMRRGESVTIDVPLEDASESLEFLAAPAFQPCACGMGGDMRRLTCRLESAGIAGADGAEVKLGVQCHGA